MAMFSIQNKVTANIQRAQTVSRTSRWRPLADTTQSWCQTPPKTARNKLHDRGIDLRFQQKSPDAGPSRLFSGEYCLVTAAANSAG